MPSTTHSTRSSRRLGRAGTIAAAAAIALSATVGLGIAPASAAPSTTHGDASQVSAGQAGDLTESKAAGTYKFTTHWVPVARGGHNVLSIRITGPNDKWVNGALRPSFDHCISFGDYRNDLDTDRSVNVILPSPDYFTASSYSSPNCNDDGIYTDGFGPIDSVHHSWTIFAHHMPASRR